MKKKKLFYRAQPVICGKDLQSAGYFDLDIYPVSEREHRARPRASRRLTTTLAQANRNERNAVRYFVRLVNTNFAGKADARHATLNFDDEHLPKSGEEADRLMMCWWRKVKARCRWKGLPEPVMVGVTEWAEENAETGQKRVRPHCHVVMCCALPREELELLWNTGGKHCGARASLEELRANAVLLGKNTNVDIARADRGSLESLARYLTKAPKRRHRWHRSRGLAEPILPRPNDTRYTRAKLAKLIRERLDDREYWRARYPGWELRGAEAEYNEFTGWTLRMQFYRPERPWPANGKQPPPVPVDGRPVLDRVLAELYGVDPVTGEVKEQWL